LVAKRSQGARRKPISVALNVSSAVQTDGLNGMLMGDNKYKSAAKLNKLEYQLLFLMHAKSSSTKILQAKKKCGL